MLYLAASQNRRAKTYALSIKRLEFYVVVTIHYHVSTINTSKTNSNDNVRNE